MLRTVKFEIWNATREMRDRWMIASDAVQVVTNAIWQAWLVWHVANGTAAILRKWLADLKGWHNSDKSSRGDKPKLAVKPISAECGKAVYAAAMSAAPELHSRPTNLVLSEVNRLIGSRKSASGSLPGWVSILLCRESIPSSTRAQPIPFDKQCSSLLAPLENGGRFRLVLRLDCYETATKAGKLKSASHLDEVELMTNRRGIKGHEAMLWRIMEGADTLKGSSIYFDSQRKKWFALLVIERAEEAARTDLAGEAVLIPGRNVPFYLRVGGRWIALGYEDHVADIRRHVIGERKSRQAQYRFGQRSSKGHGRNRAIQSWDTRLSRRWKNFQTTYNHDITAKALRICAENGVAKLIYLQPSGAKSESRCLANAGVSEPEGWAWFQVGEFLKYKSEGSGVQLEIRKCDASGKAKVAV